MKISKLGKNISIHRKNKGYTMKRLAEISSVAYATIYDIENGKKHNLKSSTLEKIALALNLSPNDLLEIDNSNHSILDLTELFNITLSSKSIKIDGIQLTDKEKDVLKSIYKNGIDVIRVMRCS